MAHRNTGRRAAPASSQHSSPNDRAASNSAEGSLSICVFCGSSPGKDPAYAQAARDLGRLIGEKGHRLVFGGGFIGLMGEVARAASDAGAPIVGILPEILRHVEPPRDAIEELILTDDLQQRKTRMMDIADAFVILPGGMGTMDEYFEVATTAQLSVHHKPIVLIDVNGYFEPLEGLIRHIVSHGFASDRTLSLHTLVDSPEAALDTIISLHAET
jgi:uncharacterized protein (TIGR00730 family)